MFAKNGWYCAAFSHEISKEPIARRILGLPVLMARDSHGVVRAISDRCPHRFAPLHQGKRVGDAIQCPYHGLRFDLQSGACVFNPHGDGEIAKGAGVPAYPTVETGPVVWLWPGNPERADPSEIPDLELFDTGDVEFLGGHLKMPVNYQLVLDNLLDLSHAQYIHAGTLSVDPKDGGKREIKNQVGDRSIKVSAKLPNVKTPSSQALFYDDERGDFHSHIEWIFPGTLRHNLSMTKVDGDFESGARTTNAHLITPETETSTHYFWTQTRNKKGKMDNKEINEATKKIITNAFLNEDEPMIAACQEYMEQAEFFSLKPLFLKTDLAGTRCRRIIQRFINEEAAESESSNKGSRNPVNA